MILSPARLTPPFAHRGLWTPGGAPENSLAAFEAAGAAGYGIELDVQLSADGEAMVFHDDDLARMTGRPGRIADHTAAELGRIPLAGGPETIPTLDQALAAAADRAFVIIELKSAPGREGALERRVAEAAAGNPCAYIGFNAQSAALLATLDPGTPRGFSMTARDDGDWTERFTAGVALSQPQFLVMEAGAAARSEVVKARAEGLPVTVWTIRTLNEAKAIAPLSDNIIFEGFNPWSV